MSKFCTPASLPSVYPSIKKSSEHWAVAMAGDLRSTISVAAFYKYHVPAHDFQEYNVYLE